MPDFLHPPYAPTAQQIPRQLNRWLDINAQNGPLERTQSFFTLPAFNQAFDWRGFSEIAIAYNFEGPNNFSVKFLSQGSQSRGVQIPIPSNPNYSLAIMWIDKAGIVNRYFFWVAAASVFYFPIEMYSSEKVLKNFRLEVWTTPASPVVQVTALNFYTSVRGNQDYRFGTDFTLVKADAPCTTFNINGDATPIFIKGAGSIRVNGVYRVIGVSSGKPIYSGPHGINLLWNPLGSNWQVFDVVGPMQYSSFDNVATPDLATTWVRDLINGPGTLLPVPSVVKTSDFALPINFPANSVPQPN